MRSHRVHDEQLFAQLHCACKPVYRTRAVAPRFHICTGIRLPGLPRDRGGATTMGLSDMLCIHGANVGLHTLYIIVVGQLGALWWGNWDPNIFGTT